MSSKVLVGLKTLMVGSVLLVGAYASAATVNVSVKGEEMVFVPAKFSVKAGEKVTLVFKNASKSMQHNLVITAPGAADKVTNDSLAAGADKGWTSAGAEVLFKTKLVDPTKTETIKFDAPKDKGDFPFLCTFLGHDAIMRGVMTVK